MTSPRTPPPAPVWQGRASGVALGEMLNRRGVDVGVPVEVDVQPWSLAGGYGVSVTWGDAPAQTLFCEVADWVDGVRLLDSGDADVTVQQALAYFEARLSGLAYGEAMHAAGVWRTSWFSRWRRRRRARPPGP